MPIVLQSLPRFVRLVGHVKDIPLDGAICLLLLFSSEKVQSKKIGVQIILKKYSVHTTVFMNEKRFKLKPFGGSLLR